MGVPPKRMVYFMEHVNYKWMMTRGTPILGNLQIGCTLETPAAVQRLGRDGHGMADSEALEPM